MKDERAVDLKSPTELPLRKAATKTSPAIQYCTTLLLRHHHPALLAPHDDKPVDSKKGKNAQILLCCSASTHKGQMSSNPKYLWSDLIWENGVAPQTARR
eukprot:gb/GECG01015018.1/.p1 GENE.gb/GECG01015018.1/~~gb/GECG01015018.1/.p1  ORF type:complete len:100 (+),score=14.21 gb/GECG01015018.1/:1-300(+)